MGANGNAWKAAAPLSDKQNRERRAGRALVRARSLASEFADVPNPEKAREAAEALTAYADLAALVQP